MGVEYDMKIFWVGRKFFPQTQKSTSDPLNIKKWVIQKNVFSSPKSASSSRYRHFCVFGPLKVDLQKKLAMRFWAPLLHHTQLSTRNTMQQRKVQLHLSIKS